MGGSYRTTNGAIIEAVNGRAEELREHANKNATDVVQSANARANELRELATVHASLVSVQLQASVDSIDALRDEIRTMRLWVLSAFVVVVALALFWP